MQASQTMRSQRRQDTPKISTKRSKKIDLPTYSNYKKKKEAKRRLRRLQKQQTCIDRETLHKEIMSAEEDDQQLFYKLVNKQLKHHQQATNSIIAEEKELNKYTWRNTTRMESAFPETSYTRRQYQHRNRPWRSSQNKRPSHPTINKKRLLLRCIHHF